MKRGDIFTHAYWLDAAHKPLVCRVTRVAQGVVYWRPVDGGTPYHFPIEQISKYVKPNAETI